MTFLEVWRAESMIHLAREVTRLEGEKEPRLPPSPQAVCGCGERRLRGGDLVHYPCQQWTSLSLLSLFGLFVLIFPAPLSYLSSFAPLPSHPLSSSTFSVSSFPHSASSTSSVCHSINPYLAPLISPSICHP